MDLNEARNRALRLIWAHLFAQEESSSEEEEIEEPTPLVPPPKDLLNHPLHNEIVVQTASGPGLQDSSIFKMIHQRSSGSRIQGNPFISQVPLCSLTARTHLSQRFIPTHPTKITQHQDYIFSGIFSDDGNMLMTACKDSSIKLFNTNLWTQTKEIKAKGVGWSIISTDFSPDQKWVIYSSWNPKVHMCNTTGGHQTHEALDMKPNDRQDRFCLFSIQFSKDSKEIVGGSSDQHIYVYDLERRERILRIRAHQDDVNAVAFADSSCQILFSGSDDNLIKIWDRRLLDSSGSTSKGCVGVLQGHKSGISYIDSKMDGFHLISNGKDQCIKLWDIRSMQEPASVAGHNHFPRQNGWDYEVRTRRGGPDHSLFTYRGHSVVRTLIRCRFSPMHSTGQRYIYTGSGDGSVFVYDLLTGEIITRLQGHRAIVRDVHWHPWKPELVTGAWDGCVKKWHWDSSTKQIVQQQLEPPIDDDY